MSTLPETMEVTVTREQAAKGFPRDNLRHPICWALRERFPDCLVQIHQDALRLLTPEDNAVFYTVQEDFAAYTSDYDGLDYLSNAYELRVVLPADWPESITFTLTRREP